MTVVRFVLRGALTGVLAGAALGLVLGLVANPATAWFAMIEIGLPAAVIGAVIGLVLGVAVTVRRSSSVDRDPDIASGRTSKSSN